MVERTNGLGRRRRRRETAVAVAILSGCVVPQQPSEPAFTVDLAATASDDQGRVARAEEQRRERAAVDELVALRAIVVLPNSMARDVTDADRRKECGAFFEKAIALGSHLTPSLRVTLLSLLSRGPDSVIEVGAAAIVLGVASDEAGRMLPEAEIERWKRRGYTRPDEVVAGSFDEGSRARREGIASVCGD